MIIQKYKISYVKERDSVVDREQRTITNKSNVREACKKFLSDMPVEHVCIYAMNGANKILGFTVFEGAVNQCALYPSNVFRFLLSAGAAAFIIAHNHPGGSKYPSEADWTITERLKKAGDLLEIPMLDHIIVTDVATISFRDFPRWKGL